MDKYDALQAPGAYGFIFYSFLILSVILFIAGAVQFDHGEREFDQDKRQHGIIMLSIAAVIFVIDISIVIIGSTGRGSNRNDWSTADNRANWLFEKGLLSPVSTLI